MTHTVTLKPKRYWKENAALLAKQAETMSNDKLAEAHNATPKQIRNQLHKLGIKSRAADNATAARKAHLQVLAAKLTATQLADREGKTVSAIRQELTRLGLKAVPVKRNVWADRRPQLEEYAKTHTAQQLADKYRCDVAHMYRLLNRFDITAQPAKPGPARRTPQPSSTRNPPRPAWAPHPHAPALPAPRRRRSCGHPTCRCSAFRCQTCHATTASATAAAGRPISLGKVADHASSHRSTDMLNALASLTKAAIGAAVETPVAVVADVITLGGSMTDKAEPYTATAVKKVVENIQDATKPE